MAGIQRLKPYAGPTLLSYGFRPYFLLGSIWAGLEVLAWLPVFYGELSLATAFSPRDWHVHELLFGLIPAIVTGFLLKAIPNWTGRLPLQGSPLAVLVLVWLAGRWAGDRTFSDRLVLVLHAAYAFLPLGFLLVGLSAVGITAPSAGIHAWTAGAMGLMTLAVMSRASLGHPGRPLVASPALQAIYAAALTAALARICTGLHPDWGQALLPVAAFAWSAAFLGFASLYAPIPSLYSFYDGQRSFSADSNGAFRHAAGSDYRLRQIPKILRAGRCEPGLAVFAAINRSLEGLGR